MSNTEPRRTDSAPLTAAEQAAHLMASADKPRCPLCGVSSDMHETPNGWECWWCAQPVASRFIDGERAQHVGWALGFYDRRGVAWVMNLKPMTEGETYTVRSKQTNPANFFAVKITAELWSRMAANYPNAVPRESA